MLLRFNYNDIMPQYPFLLIMVQFEKSFDPSVLQKNNRTNVTCHVLNSYHG